MGNSMTARYETAEKTGTLTLARSRLKKFPPSIRRLTDNLRTLDLSENSFVRLPDEIGNFTLLKQLNVSRNELACLPDILGTLTKLETLDVSSNRMSEIPDSLSRLSNLKRVNLSENRITEFPLAFRGLKHLDVLDLSGNRLTLVPDAASDLYVIELNLDRNRIAEISDKIAECSRLRTLRLEENCLRLEAIPTAILADSKISTLALDGNLFESKKLADAEGYDAYMERYTAVKKKLF